MRSAIDELLIIKGEHHVRNNFNRGIDFNGSGHAAYMASQPSMGLLPKWWAWIGIIDSNHTLTNR